MIELIPTDVLLVVDVQNDFTPAHNGIGGALAVPEGDAIIPTINRLAQRFENVILTQDWHPRGHISFASTHPGTRPFEHAEVGTGPHKTFQTLWPDHCVQGTPGAALHPALDIPHAQLILRKGFHPDIDSYSAFRENDQRTQTGLASYLRERNLERIFLCGLAYDFCVRYSALDGTALGFQCLVIEDATRPVALPGTVEATNAAFAEKSVRRIQSTELRPTHH